MVGSVGEADESLGYFSTWESCVWRNANQAVGVKTQCGQLGCAQVGCEESPHLRCDL